MFVNITYKYEDIYIMYTIYALYLYLFVVPVLSPALPQAGQWLSH
jgi:hypothetical protein